MLADTAETFSVLDSENMDSQVKERSDVYMSSNSLSDDVFKSTVLSGLASLKSELAEVKSDLRLVEQKQQVNNNQPQCAVQSHPCLLYLRLFTCSCSPLGKNGLQILLGCAVEQYVLLKSKSYSNTYKVLCLMHEQVAASLIYGDYVLLSLVQEVLNTSNHR